VSREEGHKFGEEIKGIFAEVSAKTGENITEFFQVLVSNLLGLQPDEGPAPKIELETQKNNPNSNLKNRIQLMYKEFHLDINKETATGGNTVPQQQNPKKGGCCS
jgi:hypothetical protein